MSDAVLILEKVRKRYRQGAEALEVLKGVDLTLNKGEIVALVGPSGAGKSTLLHIAGLLDVPTDGKIQFAGQNVTRMSERKRSQFRGKQVGFVYQFHHLLPEFTALENAMMPQIIAGVARPKAEIKASEILARLGLGDRQTHRPSELSGGEQQRVAIARALANNPPLLLADEPTGNLDTETAEQVFSLFIDLARERGVATLMATHNPELAQRADRIITLENGRLS